MGSDRIARPKTLVDSWYSGVLRPKSIMGLDAAIEQRFPKGVLGPNTRLAMSLRGGLWFLVARDAERVICTLASKGLTLFLVLQAIAGRDSCKIYILEFFRAKRTSRRDRFVDWMFRVLYRPLLKRTLTRAQVPTEWEIDAYAREFRLPPSRFHYVPLALVRYPTHLPSRSEQALATVFASGRNACDWPTLFSASRGASWRLTVVCSAKDLPLVNELNSDGAATVLSEIPLAEHNRLLSQATVFALALREQFGSGGQVRIAQAIEFGVPVVATSVMAMRGYLEPDVTGIAVPPADSVALRDALDRLIENPQLRDQLRERAYEAGRQRSMETYLGQIRQMVFDDRHAAPNPTGLEEGA